MTTEALTSNMPASAPRPKFSTLIFPWALVALLAITNVATLLSERIHNAAFGVLTTAATLAGQVAADAILARSPTKAKAQAVDIATRQIQNELTGLQTKNRALTAESDAIKASRSVLEREHRALRIENDTVKTSRAALANENETLRTVAAKRARTVRAVATKTTSLLATRSAGAIKTLPMRAAPYVGIAALIGFTTVELKADCELAQEIAKLNAEHGNDPIDIGQICKAVEMVPSPQQTWNSVKTESSVALRSTYDALEVTASRLGLTTSTQPPK